MTKRPNWFKRNLNKLGRWISSNYRDWVLEALKIILVAYFSFYIFKEVAKINVVEVFWAESERFYLGSYVAIQVLVTFLFYTLIGVLFDFLIVRWIRKNRRGLAVELGQDAKDDIQKIILKIVKFVTRFHVVEFKDFESLTDLSLKKKDLKKEWRSTRKTINNLLGILLLTVLNLFVYYETKTVFVWLTVVFIIIAVGSFLLLIIFYLLMENLNEVKNAVDIMANSETLLNLESAEEQMEEE